MLSNQFLVYPLFLPMVKIVFHSLCLALAKRTHNKELQTPDRKKWVTFKYFSPAIRRITNLFRDTNLKIAFRPHNTTQQQLTKKKVNTNPSGIYRLQCNTCKDVYVGQSGRDINTRYKEHIRYIRTNNPTSAYASHILNNRHEIGTSMAMPVTQYNY